MEVLISEFGETEGAEVTRVERAAIDRYSDLLRNYPTGPIDGSVSVRNIGQGADWSVLVLVLSGIVVAIPEVHKRIREGIEEWGLIFKKLKSMYAWLVGTKTAIYPDQYLFLVALFFVAERAGTNDLVFLGCMRLPEDNPDLRSHEPLLFSFISGEVVNQVAVDRNANVLWKHDLLLPSTAALRRQKALGTKL